MKETVKRVPQPHDKNIKKGEGPGQVKKVIPVQLPIPLHGVTVFPLDLSSKEHNAVRAFFLSQKDAV